MSGVKAKRVAPMLYQAGDTQVQIYAIAEHGMASADVLVWAANQILTASGHGLQASQTFRFALCRLLIAITRASANDKYEPLNGAFAPQPATAVGTTIQRGEHCQGRQFSSTNQCEELYVRALATRLVLALDSAYFALSAGRQSDGWRFKLRHFHEKSASPAPLSHFALDICRIAARQPLIDHAITVQRHGLELTVFSQIDPPVLLISNRIPSCYRDSGRLLSGRQCISIWAHKLAPRSFAEQQIRCT